MKAWQKKLPMWITWSRILLVPVIVLLLFSPALSFRIVAALLFIVASISDYYDGYYARKFNATSDLGKLMDPIADKILVTSILVMLIPARKVDPIMVIVLLIRDHLISGLRSAAAAEGVVIAAKPAGKWKTGLQMVAIPAIIVGDIIEAIPFDKLGYYALWVSVILSVTSAWEYGYSYLKNRKG